MGLKCPNCGSKDTIITTYGELEEASKQVKTIPAGAAAGALTGFIGLDLIEKILDLIIKNNEKYIVCKDCGHWEKL